MLPTTQRENIYSGNIKVSIRVKPPLKDSPNIVDSLQGPITTINNHWTIDSEGSSISAKDVGEFSFDHVFHGPIHNSKVFDASVKELVGQVMAGFNGTVFAYGMTGSGKTYSMQGSTTNAGIIPLSVAAIFNGIKSDQSFDYTVKVSYLEIYNEQLHDLLSPNTPSEGIKLRDDIQRGVKAIGLKEVIVTTPEALIENIQNGDALRRTEGTEFNSKSSRSHAVVQITVEATAKGKTGVTPRTSTLYLCDLAGSERAAQKTERRKEGAFINKSLLTLGTVIARLSVASTSSSLSSAGGHIPYRDSKLTRLLQPALSGKSLVSVLCTVDLCNMSNNTESISTLRFAARAKNIMVSVKRSNEGSADSGMIEKLLAQVETLRTENETLKRNGGYTAAQSPALSSVSASQIAQLKAENRILHERVEHLTRLCDDNRLEELIGLGIDDGSSVIGPSTPSRPQSALSHRSFGILSDEGYSSLGGDDWRRKETEYKSYISHLEKQLYTHEMRNRAAGTNNPNNKPNGPYSPEISSPSGMFSPLKSGFPLGTFPSAQEQYFKEVITELKEEVSELKESNSDKDRIISALRSINKRKENLSALSTSNSSFASSLSPPPAPASLSSSSLYHSPAYSRYYYSNTYANSTPPAPPESSLLANISLAALNSTTTGPLPSPHNPRKTAAQSPASQPRSESTSIPVSL